MTLEDRKRMAKSLDLSLKEFTARYCHKTDGFWALADNPAGGDCIFLKNKRCSVYEGRPTQCRTWPFWPEVLNARSWKKNVASFCPGVGKGRTHTLAEIEAQLKAQELSETALVLENKKV